MRSAPVRLTCFAGIALLNLVLVTATHAQEAPTDQGVYVLDGSASFRSQAGFTYMLARNVGVTTTAFFLYERLGSDGAEAQTSNTVGVQVGITAFIF